MGAGKDPTTEFALIHFRKRKYYGQCIPRVPTEKCVSKFYRKGCSFKCVVLQQIDCVSWQPVGGTVTVPNNKLT